MGKSSMQFGLGIHGRTALPTDELSHFTHLPYAMVVASSRGCYRRLGHSYKVGVPTCAAVRWQARASASAVHREDARLSLVPEYVCTCIPSLRRIDVLYVLRSSHLTVINVRNSVH